MVTCILHEAINLPRNILLESVQALVMAPVLPAALLGVSRCLNGTCLCGHTAASPIALPPGSGTFTMPQRYKVQIFICTKIESTAH